MPDSPQIETVQRPLSPRIRRAVALLVSGECRTQKAAAAQAGISEAHLCVVLNSPRGRTFLAERTRQTIQHAQAPAAATLIKLLDASSEHVAAQVAEKLLAINGIAAPEQRGVSVGVTVQVGYVLDLQPQRTGIVDVTPSDIERESPDRGPPEAD